MSFRFTGTIVGCENLDPLWPDSSWRYLKVTAYSMFNSIMVLNLMFMEGCFFSLLLTIGALG
jgi:hypothetical protein